MPEAGGPGAGSAADADLLAEARAEDLLFLDLETTGLHRGIIVLLGFMRLGPGEKPLTCTQLFPRSYHEEAPLLGRVHRACCAQRPVLVTFNGRSFDAPFLESRLRFHGWFEPLSYAHVDLLHLARRLWRGLLPDYRLHTLERRLFGRRRLADLPGSEVPRVWEDYERGGELRHLPGIWEHNLRDIATLAELLVRAVESCPSASRTVRRICPWTGPLARRRAPDLYVPWRKVYGSRRMPGRTGSAPESPRRRRPWPRSKTNRPAAPASAAASRSWRTRSGARPWTT